MQSVAVFCGSKPGSNPTYREQARAFGAALADAGVGLVYGGAVSGLMGALADGVLEKGGEVIGVMPVQLEGKERIHPGLSQLIEVDSLQQRKAEMQRLSQGFVALPGGTGTLDEWFEMYTQSQLGIHRYPCALLNVDGYYDDLIRFLSHCKQEQFLHPDYLNMLISETCPRSLLEQMTRFKHPHR